MELTVRLTVPDGTPVFAISEALTRVMIDTTHGRDHGVLRNADDERVGEWEITR